MPWTLWRYIFIEVGRLVLLSTAVLVAVIAFAATVKPLADGKLTALDALRFMFYAVPPMLAYALPFAAGFGATLAYHRMAQDNEVTASFAGGLSHLKVLTPALAIGAVLSLGLAMLNAQIIPRFLTRMEKIVTKDLAQVMIRSLEQGESASFGDVQIHADAVSRVEPSSEDIDDQFRLVGVVALQLDETGDIVVEVTASEAYVFMFKAEHLPEAEREGIHPSKNVVRMHFVDAFAMQRRSGEVIDQESITSPPYELPSAFQDDPKFLTAGQLRELRGDPERMNWIDERRLELARAIASDETIESIRARAEDTGTVTFRNAAGVEHRLRTGALVWDGPTKRWRVRPPPGLDRVELEVYPNGSLERYRAERAWLEPVRVKPDDPFTETTSGSLTFELTLDRVEVRTGGTTTTERPRWSFDGLSVDGDPYPALRAMPSAELIARAETLDKGAINSRSERLVREIGKLNREITSKQHERLAMNASCLVMVFTGAVMALRLRHALPLVVYMWSFFPALGTIIFISSGQQTTHRQGWIGLPLLWFGVFGLGAFAVWMYLKLRRH